MAFIKTKPSPVRPDDLLKTLRLRYGFNDQEEQKTPGILAKPAQPASDSEVIAAGFFNDMLTKAQERAAQVRADAMEQYARESAEEAAKLREIMGISRSKVPQRDMTASEEFDATVPAPESEPLIETDTLKPEQAAKEGLMSVDTSSATQTMKETIEDVLETVIDSDDTVSTDSADGGAATEGKGLMSLPPSESRSGVFEMAEADAKDIALDKIGIDETMWEAYKKQVSKIESGGEKNPYGAKGGYNDHYDGKYQLGKDAKADAASLLGITLGHGNKDRDAFRKNPALQEKAFAAYTAKNHQYMLNKSEIYRNLDKEQQLAVLGYAHNQGAGGASKWLRSGEAERDAFDTSADKYYKAVAKELGITPSLAFTPGRETSPRPMLRPEENES